jgi:ATP-dependent Clp protease ATP-binding subunit ClpA
MSRAGKRAIDAAAAAAERLGHARLDTLHLLIGLALEKTAAQAALGKRGATAEKLEKGADALYDGPRGGKAREIDRSGGELREALAMAQDEADTAGAHEIGPAHLLLAATADDSWTATAALKALGVDVEALRADVPGLEHDEKNDAL